jgi:hypothetical protein
MAQIVPELGMAGQDHGELAAAAFHHFDQPLEPVTSAPGT